MAEYIEREALLEAMGNMYDFADPRFKRGRDVRQEMIIAMKIVKNQPAANVQEVRHGKWEEEDTERGMYVRCSECHFDGLGAGSSYCPHCGAKMEE